MRAAIPERSLLATHLLLGAGWIVADFDFAWDLAPRRWSCPRGKARSALARGRPFESALVRFRGVGNGGFYLTSAIENRFPRCQTALTGLGSTR